MNPSLRFFFESSPAYGSLDSVALFVQARQGESFGFAKPIEIEMRPREDCDNIVPRPTAVLSREDVQGLVDELWRSGWRPRQTESAAGELDATKRHLADMRKLVAKSTGCEL